MKHELDLFHGNFWNPSREMSSLQREVNRIFENFFNSTQHKNGNELLFTPACDIEETSSHYLMTFDLPGVPKDQIKIEIHGRDLIVSGERLEERTIDKKSRHFIERFQGSFRRTFTLPASVDLNKIEAAYENGILKLSLPKTEALKPKQIKISDTGESKSQSTPSQNEALSKGAHSDSPRVA